MDQEKKEQEPKTKKSNKMKWWIIGIAAFVFLAALGQAIEEIIEEQKEKKIVQAEEEAKEEKKEDKPKTTEDKVKQAVYNAVGEKSSEKKDRINLLKVNDHMGTDEEGDKLVFVKINGDMVLANRTAEREILLKAAKLFDEVFKIEEVSEISLRWLVPGTSGNEIDATYITITRETAEKIDWSKPEQIPELADEYKFLR